MYIERKYSQKKDRLRKQIYIKREKKYIKVIYID